MPGFIGRSQIWVNTLLPTGTGNWPGTDHYLWSPRNDLRMVDTIKEVCQEIGDFRDRIGRDLCQFYSDKHIFDVLISSPNPRTVMIGQILDLPFTARVA